MSKFRPAGFESSDDDDEFMFGGGENNENTANSNRAPEINDGADHRRGGFGNAPAHLTNGSASRSNGIDGKRGFQQQASWKRGEPVQSRKPGHQDATRPSAGRGRGSMRQVNAGPPPFQAPQDVIPVDDFKQAAMRGNASAVAEFLEQGVSVDIIFSSGWSALMYAANSAHAAVVKLLLDHKANANFHKDQYTALMAACSCSKSNLETDSLQCVQLLVEAGADVNAFDRYHMTALIYAAREGKASIVNELCEGGANTNKQDNKGYTALMWACMRGYVRTVQILLQVGADVSKKSCDGSTAINLGELQENKLVVELLKHFGDPHTDKVIAELDLTEAEAPAQTSHTDINQTVMKYGELEVFLSGLELANLIPTFQSQEVSFEAFLRMTDNDLQKMGIHAIGTRKKLLDAVMATHKKEWETSSLPSVQYNKQINCAEAVAMVSNIKKHASYIASTIGYITDQIKANDKILTTATEGAGPDDLCVQAEEAVTSVKLLFEELVILRQYMTKVNKHAEFRPADLITKPAVTQKKSFSHRRVASVLVIGAAIGVCIWKRDTLTTSCSHLFELLPKGS